jgi:transposase
MEPYTAEIRGEVLAACDANEGTHDVAVRFKVSETWVRRIKQQRRETGQIAPKAAAPRQPKWQAWAEWLVAKIAARPDSYLPELQAEYLPELQAELKQERGEEVSLMTICAACRALDPSRKKRR